MKAATKEKLRARSNRRAMGIEKFRGGGNGDMLSSGLKKSLCVGCMCRKGRQDSNLKPASEKTGLFYDVKNALQCSVLPQYFFSEEP
jgi:hypothetical protein